MKSYSDSYKKAGVDVTAGYESVKLMKSHIAKTKVPGAISDIGGFGGLFCPNLSNMSEPVFVSGTDGVGTKLKIAMLMDKHDTIGIDCVAMCVNDIICSGAKPLFFLDYIACGKNYPEKISTIVSGIAEGCVRSGAALIGGETAEHPGMMPEDDYDLAGFAVGVVDKSKMILPENQKPGDILIALPSSGVHSNGFSLVRKIFDIENANLNSDYGVLDKSLGETLLEPTLIYVKPILSLLDKINIKAVCHITGGGFYENIPRILPKGICAKIDSSSLVIPKIFDLIMNKGNIPKQDMFNTFNMGVGIVCTVSKEDVDKAIEILKSFDINAYVMGELIKGDEQIIID
ncbi:MAG: phosphoribosylformylglycinamidine cyclo-ligase [Oscillospiraceae bacterium]|nr:phosphoribosylformylglycinamidine cyclo-ligase [Oscillospiraceae bacterium]